MAKDPPGIQRFLHSAPMIEIKKWSDSSDMDAATLAEELEQLLLAVYDVSPWTMGQMEEVLRSDVNSCALAEDGSQPSVLSTKTTILLSCQMAGPQKVRDYPSMS